MVGLIKRQGQGRRVSGRGRPTGHGPSPVAEALRRRVAVRADRASAAIASRGRGRRSLDADEPPSTLTLAPAACPRCTRRSRSLRGGRSRGGRRDREGRTMNPRDRPLVVRGSGPLSSCCWSSPGPPAGRNRRPHRPRRRRTNAAVNSPGEWARRSRRYGPSQERSREPRERQSGGVVAAWAERSRL
jgi:hypothetical protein